MKPTQDATINPGEFQLPTGSVEHDRVAAISNARSLAEAAVQRTHPETPLYNQTVEAFFPMEKTIQKLDSLIALIQSTRGEAVDEHVRIGEKIFQLVQQQLQGSIPFVKRIDPDEVSTQMSRQEGLVALPQMFGAVPDGEQWLMYEDKGGIFIERAFVNAMGPYSVVRYEKDPSVPLQLRKSDKMQPGDGETIYAPVKLEEAQHLVKWAEEYWRYALTQPHRNTKAKNQPSKSSE